MQLTDQSMVEQLKLTPRVIQKQKALFDISKDDELRLLGAKPFIEERIDEIVSQFYQRQLQHIEIEMVIGDSDTLSRLQNSMRYYVIDLFSGIYDEHYVTSRLRVGKVHKRIGVSPTLYMAAVRMLWELLTEIFEAESSFNNDAIEKSKLLKSISKILMFDAQLVFETYTGSLVYEVEQAKQELEAYSKDLEIEVAERTKELEELSRFDGLTGLMNQRSFYEQLRIDLSLSNRRNDSLCLIYFDLNGFKPINDKHGHLIGDKILKQVGDNVQQVLRSGNIGARYGGDEFCLILPSSNNDEAKTVCERLIKTFLNTEDKFDVTFSIGIIQTGPERYLTTEELVKEADQRMYKSKEKSKEKNGNWICDSDFELSNPF